MVKRAENGLYQNLRLHKEVAHRFSAYCSIWGLTQSEALEMLLNKAGCLSLEKLQELNREKEE